MVLEAFAALSLASSIVQFVDFGSKLVGQSIKIYKSKSGTSEEILDLKSLSRDLQDLTVRLQVRFVSSSPADLGIAELARLCNNEAKALSSVLQRLSGEPDSGKWMTFLQALATLWEKERIEELRKSLGLIQTQLILHLAMLTSDDQASTARHVRELSAASQRIDANTTTQLNQIQQAVGELQEISRESIRVSGLAATYSQNAISLMNDSLIRNSSNWLTESQKTYKMGQQIPYNSKYMDSISEKVQDVVTTGRAISIENEILRSLQFDKISMRQSNVAQAHTETFEWIFRQPAKADGTSVPGLRLGGLHAPSSKAIQPKQKTPDSRNHLLDWLLHGSGIFWVSGKPGSGKSTFMKFLCNHKATRAALEKWAGGRPLVTASYFFWNAGTAMQKSQQGLLQTLLYWVLRQSPSLAKYVCPSRWEQVETYTGINAAAGPWTLEELMDSFDHLLQQNPSSAKFCFFVDGLDEYDGIHSEIVEILQKLATFEHMKICTSSRPWNVFLQAYGTDASRFIRLQNLTRGDIDIYVRENFDQNNQFMLLKRMDPRYNLLVGEIVNKADGVFLWVVLVVRSLKEGITNADTIDILQKRLAELPSDLESFFRHILRQVDKVYMEGTSQVFFMAVAAVEPIPLMEYAVLDERPEFAFKLKRRQLSREEIEQQCIILEKRLNARCKGLLEVTEPPTYANQFVKRRVDFLHRTVRDFLRLSEIVRMLISQLEKPFDTLMTLCKCLLIYAKRIPEYEDVTLQNIMDDLTYYAHYMELASGKTPTRVLDEFMCLLAPKHDPSVFSNKFHPFIFQKSLLLYLKNRLNDKSKLLDVIHMPDSGESKPSFLDATLTPLSAHASKYTMYPRPEVVQLLIERGEQPNRFVSTDDRITTWTRFLRTLYTSTDSFTGEDQRTLFAVVELLLQAGADPKAEVNVAGKYISIRDVFRAVFKDSQVEVLQNALTSGPLPLMQDKGARKELRCANRTTNVHTGESIAAAGLSSEGKVKKGRHKLQLLSFIFCKIL